MQVDFTVDLTAHVEAKINLFIATITVFSHDWNLGRLVDIHQAVATMTTHRARQLALIDQQLSIEPDERGVLTLNGQSDSVADLVTLSQSAGGVDVNWSGRGKRHYTGLTQINFVGGSGNNRLQVSPGFNVPINATAGPRDDYLEGGDGGCTLTGGAGHDTLIGGAGANHITAGSGDSLLRAGDGNSTLIGGSGKDTLYGGAGRDSLNGGSGNDVLYAGTGDTTLIGGPGSDTLHGGAGNDLLIGGSSAVANDPDTGNDYLEAGISNGNATLWAGGGRDTLVAGMATDSLAAGRKHDELHGGKGDDLLIGGAVTDPMDARYHLAGKDVIMGGAGNNTIFAGGNDDTIIADPNGTGRNTIQGGSGNDSITGGPNGDLLIAGTGNDTIRGGKGNDTLVAGTGEDWLYGGDGDDTIQLTFVANKGTVRHHLSGGNNRDTLALVSDADNRFVRLSQAAGTPLNFTVTSYSTPDMRPGQELNSFSFSLADDIEVLALEAPVTKDDMGHTLRIDSKLVVDPACRRDMEVIGGNGNDTLVGGAGQNTLWGGTGDDSLVGGTGNNEIHAGTGNSTLVAGPGDDVLYGGTGDNDMRDPVGGTGKLVMYGGNSRAGRRNRDVMQAAANRSYVFMLGGGNDATMNGAVNGFNILRGGTGNNEIHGGAQQDILQAGDGNDTLFGGRGQEVLLGGSGNDVLWALDPRDTGRLPDRDWPALFRKLDDQAHALALQIDQINTRLEDHNLSAGERQALRDQLVELVKEHDNVVVEQHQLDQDFLKQYGLAAPDIVWVGSGNRNEIHGSPFNDLVIRGDYPNQYNTIYGSAGNDTLMGGHCQDPRQGNNCNDTYVLQLPDGNLDVSFTAPLDPQSGNYIPTVRVNGQVFGTLTQQLRNIGTVSVVSGLGHQNTVVDFGQQAVVERLMVRAGNGDDRIDLHRLPIPTTVFGGLGNDTISGGSQTNTAIYGGEGDSTYEFDGTPGNDVMQVKTENYNGQTVLSTYLNGQLQAHFQVLTVKHLLVNGLAGDDHITVGPLGNFLFPDLTMTAGPGNDFLDARAVSQPVTVLGGVGNDTLYAGTGGSLLKGGVGNNILYGGDYGEDTLVGGTGNDTLYAGGANDGIGVKYVRGGHGNDVLYASGAGNRWANVLTGGSGNNRIYWFPSIAGTETTPRIVDGGSSGDNRLIYQAYSGQTVLAYAQGLKINNDWFGFRGIQNITAYEIETNGSGSTISYGTPQDDPYHLGFFRGRLYVDGRPISSMTEFGLTAGSFPYWITSGPDGNMWFTASARNQIGRITPTGAVTEFPVPTAGSYPIVIAAGPDGNLWFTEYYGNKIGTITAAGAIRESSIPTADSRPLGITTGPDGNLWFAESAANKIAKITPQGQITEYDLPKPASGISFVTAGPDGNVWFTEPQGNRIGRITPDGVFTEFGVPTIDSKPDGITTGPDGNLWFTEAIASKIGRMTPQGQFIEYPLPTANRDPIGIMAGPDGNLWFAEYGGNNIGRITLTGAITEFSVPTANGHPQAVAFDTNGNLWFQEINGQKVGRFIPPPAATFRVPAPANATAGTPFSVTVTALDNSGTTASGYQGTVHFTSSDGQAVLPTDYTFTAADRGVHTFTVTLKTAGTPSLQVADTVISTLVGITIPTAPPINVPTTTSNPYWMVAGRDGNLWFTERGGGKIGRLEPATGQIQESSTTAAEPLFITAGPQGDPNLYFDTAAGTIEQTGTITPLVRNPGAHFRQIITGPDNNLYVAAEAEAGYKIYRISRTGGILASADLTQQGAPWGITVGPDGYLWFTERYHKDGSTGNRIGRIDPATLSYPQYFDLTPGSEPWGITTGPDGSVWFTEYSGNRVGRINPVTGTVTEFPLPAGGLHPSSITTGPDGNLWFDYGPSRLGRMNPNGLITEFPFVAGAGVPTPGPRGDASVWYFTGSNQIGRVLLGIPVAPAGAVSFRLATSASSPIAGTPFNVTVTALDAYGNVVTGYRGAVHFTSTDTQAALPADYTFTASDSGVHTLTITLKTAGSQTVTATDTAVGSIHGSAAVAITPAAADHLRVTPAAGTADAGTSFTVTVTALDPYNNIATGYRGIIHFTSTDPQAGLPSDYTFTAADNGVHTFPNGVTLKTAGNQTLTARDTAIMPLSGNTVVTVRPGLARTLQVANVPASVQAGTPFPITVMARDAYGNVAAGYSGTIHFSPFADATLPPDYLFTAADAGTHTLMGLIYRLVGSRSLTVSDGGGLMASGTFQVTPAPASQFQVAGFPSPITAGAGGTFTVTALDPFGNVDVHYAGTVHFSSSDPGSRVVLPPNYQFTATDAGVHTFTQGATLVTAGTQTLTATDAQVSTITGSQGGILVTPAALDHFLVATSVAGSRSMAGSPFDVTVTARDAYNNTVTGYTGTTTFSSQDPYGATLPPEYTFQPNDQGTVTFRGGATLYTVGTWDVTVTDTGNPNLTGSDNVVVTPAPASQFLITAPATVTAGMAFDFTVTAVDPYGNTDTNYTGTVVFSTLDPAGTFSPTGYTFQPSDLGTATFPGGATLNTLGSWDVTATDVDSGITGSATVTVASSDAPGVRASGKHTVAVEAVLSPTASATPAEGAVRNDVDSIGPIPGRGAIDLDSRPFALEPQLAAGRSHPRDTLWEALDLFFSEDLFR